MKIGDLVVATDYEWHNYGIVIIIGEKFGGLKIFWPERGVWCYTGIGGVKPLCK